MPYVPTSAWRIAAAMALDDGCKPQVITIRRRLSTWQRILRCLGA